MTKSMFSSLTTIPKPIPKGIHIQYEHHFFIQANVTVQDNQQNTRVSIQFNTPENGTYLARVHPKVFSRWKKNHPDQPLIQLSGSWRVTLYGKTFNDQRLSNLTLVRVVPLENAIDLNGVDTFWSAAGKVLRLDRAEKLVLLRIYPMDTKTEPFVVSAKTTLELLNLVEDARYLQMSGVLEQGYLIAQNLEPMRLEIPDHWKKWIPPT
ncbi:MAG: hypothetical protein RLZZ156_2693, partial [Deinococcota bacterium]